MLRMQGRVLDGSRTLARRRTAAVDTDIYRGFHLFLGILACAAFVRVTGRMRRPPGLFPGSMTVVQPPWPGVGTEAHRYRPGVLCLLPNPSKRSLRGTTMQATRPLVETDPFLSSHLEALETDPQAIGERAGRSVQCESRVQILFRHSGWAVDRRRVAASIARTGQPDSRQDAFRDCGSMAHVLRSIEDPTKYRLAGSACHDRFCLPCAAERSRVIAHNVCEAIADREIRFVTLTIKTDGLSLATALDKLYDSFQKLRRRAMWHRAIFGGIAFLEITYNKKLERWHPHLHCLVDGTWIDQKRLRSTWYEITGDSFIVDIRRPACNKAVGNYVAKYASKPFNTTFLRNETLLDEALVALKGRKLCLTFGRWRGLVLTATPDVGTWEHVASLARVISRAANGDTSCQRILRSLTDQDLAPIYERAPPEPPYVVQRPNPDIQLEWFGTWQHDGTFKCPND